jgi:hypothetical protein
MNHALTCVLAQCNLPSQYKSETFRVLRGSEDDLEFFGGNDAHVLADRLHD